VLHGLLRVRGFTQDDAHIFCTEEQVTGEVIGVIDFVTDALNMFGFKEFGVELSTRPTKSIGTDAQWKQAEGALTEALKAKGLKYQINEGDGAFYGPKIDIKLKDALKREWQCATVQCDFALSERFDLTYDGADGKEHRPVMLHRVILGSMERFLGALIEHYAGAFPLWLAPVQAVVIPITDEQADYAKEIASKLRQEGIRVECDLRREKMQYKIRAAQMQKVPYMLVAGKREQEAKKIAVRSRQKGDEGVVTIDELANRIKIENDQKQ
ncbi:MAG: threonine--tRNA ligase, partial [Candidatus Omnitrophica bacterium]|nr:threonine--tRNA ligase [Candidatus Omnitrophota bacterium]